MIYKTNSALFQDLLSKPETGMGYQIIDALVSGHSTKDRFVVYNSSLIAQMDIDFPVYKRRLFSEGYTKMLNSVGTISLSSVTLVTKQALSSSLNLGEVKNAANGRYSGGQGARQNPKLLADGKSSYVRLSAYEDDKRVDFVNNKFIPGTYATTIDDYQTCKNLNDDPIDRYALPNDEKIKWTFYVLPKNIDYIQQGIVQPAFNHAGGGLEVFFEDGTSNGTYYKKAPY